MNLRSFLLCLALVFACTVASPAVAAVTGFLKIDDIPGESLDREHKGWIDILAFEYAVEAGETALVGRGRARARSTVLPVQFEKLADVASVYLNLAALQGRSFERAEFEVYEDGVRTFRYEFTNVRLTSYRTEFSTGDEAKRDSFALVFESIRVIHYRTNEDQSAGDEHEIEYDIAAGV